MKRSPTLQPLRQEVTPQEATKTPEQVGFGATIGLQGMFHYNYNLDCSCLEFCVL